MATVVTKKVDTPKVVEKPTPTPKPLPREGFVVVAMDIKHNSLYHPYQRRWVPTIIDLPEGLEMELDSWLQCQIDAGLVKVLK